MVKAIYAANHKGLTDWLVQHISAFIMAVYTISLVCFLMCQSIMDYVAWSALFNQAWMKVSTVVVFLLLLFHAWVGIWTVITDYIKCSILRLTLYVIVLLSLLTFFIVLLAILWGV
ncbi:succinate dehydrogenase, hydrophobic membrane anchor protein [Gammaproteobacteria bacterium]|nr:succinate dehydrogenase, hydrophobic membrane anchor protein [Gammaproteobacteria bacterium]